jgi:hypothetical protein
MNEGGGMDLEPAESASGFAPPRLVASISLLALVGAGLLAPRTIAWMNRIPNCTPAGDRSVPLFGGVVVAMSLGLLVLIVLGLRAGPRNLKVASVAAALGLICLVTREWGWFLSQYVFAAATAL